MRLSFLKKGWVILSTVVLISLVFIYYFLVYVKNQESEIIQNNMRVLAQIKKNIKSLEQSYLKNAETFLYEQAEKNDILTEGESLPLDPKDSSKLKTPGSYVGGTQMLFVVDTSRVAFVDNPNFMSMSFEKFFGHGLIKRKDVFDFIAVYRIDKEKPKTLYSNIPSGYVTYPKTLDSLNSIFQVDLGYAQYHVFNNLIIDNEKEGTIYLAGFVNKVAFNGKKRQVPLVVITLASIIIILIILCFPLIKLKVMSNVERLYITDVFFSGASVIITPSILIIFILGTVTYYNSTQIEAKEQLGTLSTKVGNGLVQELECLTELLEDWRDRVKPLQIRSVEHLIESCALKELENKGIEKKIYLNDTTEEKEYVSYHQVNYDQAFEKFPYFNGIFWADSAGKPVVLLSAIKNPSRVTDLKHRTYIMGVEREETHQFGEKEIALESIRSVNDGSFEIGIGMKSGIDKFPVIAASSPLSSVMSPIVEPGYGFCVFNRQGETLFHSDSEKNLNENFLKETNDLFDPYVANGVSYFTSGYYNGIDQYIKVTPLKEIEGLYLATFVDKQYITSINAISLYTTLIIEFAFLTILIVIYFVIYASTTKRTKLKQQVFPFNWLRPYDQENYHRLYRHLFSLNAAGIGYLLLTWWFFLEDVNILINSLLLVILGLLFIGFYTLSRDMPYQKRIFTAFYVKEVSGKGKKSDKDKKPNPNSEKLSLWLKRFASWLKERWEMIKSGLSSRLGPFWVISWGLVLLLVIHRVNMADLSLGSWLGLTYYFIPMVLVFICFEKPKLLKKFKEKTDNLITRLRGTRPQGVLFRGYKYYLFSWVILVSVIPTLIFYGINVRKEQEVYLKQQGYHLHHRLLAWKGEKASNYKKSDFEKTHHGKTFGLHDFIGFMRKDSLHWAIEEDTYNRYRDHGNESEVVMLRTNPSDYDSLYFRIRAPFNQYGQITQGFAKEYSPGHRWKYEGKRIAFLSASKKPTVLASFEAGSNSNSFSWLSSLSISGRILLGIVLLSAIAFFYRTLVFMTHRIFGLDFKKFSERLVHKDVEEFKELFAGNDEKEKKGIIDSLLEEDQKISFNNTIMVGVNASHISVIKEGLKKRKWPNGPKVSFISIDLYDIEEVPLPQFEEVISEEKKTEDTSSSRFKLNEMLKRASEKVEPKNLLDVLFSEKQQKEAKNFVVFIEHFEFAYNDVALNKTKLNILQRLVDHPSVCVIISSEINPYKIYDFYEDQIRNIRQNLGKTNDQYLEMMARMDELKVDYKKWLNLLGSFVKVTLPLHQVKEEVVSSEVLRNEVNHGYYLQKLEPYLEELPATQMAEEDQTYRWHHEDYILKIQESSYPYYFSIWNSLSKEERYIVYDIAKDKFVNTNNVDGIIDLLHKGVLVYDHSLRLMNESFSNFILSKVNSDEALERELESRKKGKWGKASAILIILIVSLIVFISFGQMSVLDDFNTLISSLAAVFALFLRVGGIVSFGKSQG